MKDIIETSKYKLSTISKNRYKIEMKSEIFTKELSKKISGCYFSGPQKAWVFLKNEINLKVFKSLFDIIELKNEVKEEEVNIKLNTDKNYTSIDIKIPQSYINMLIFKKYSEPTQKTYIAHFKRFISYYNSKNPKIITFDEIREYLIYLVKTKKLSASAQNQTINAIKFYYKYVLEKNIDHYYLQRPKKTYYQPSILSKEDIRKILKSIINLKHKCIIYLIYSTGLIQSEIVYIKIKDIDSKNMKLFISSAKGYKDRFVLLSEKILTLLKYYYIEYKPKYWLFEGQTGGQYSKRSIQHIFKNALEKSGVKKYATIKTLKNSFAVHLIESGIDIRYIQQILGHKSIETTKRYLKVSKESISVVKSPLDDMNLE